MERYQGVEHELLAISPVEHDGMPLTLTDAEGRTSLYYFGVLYNSSGETRVTSESLQAVLRERYRLAFDTNNSLGSLIESRCRMLTDRLNQQPEAALLRREAATFVKELTASPYAGDNTELQEQLAHYTYEIGRRQNRYQDVRIVFDADQNLILPKQGSCALTLSVVNTGKRKYQLDSLMAGFPATVSLLQINQEILPFWEIRRKLVINYDPNVFAQAAERCFPLPLFLDYRDDSLCYQYVSRLNLRIVEPVTASFIPNRLLLTSSDRADRPDWQVRSRDIAVRFINHSSSGKPIKPSFKVGAQVAVGAFPKELELPPKSITVQQLKINFKGGSRV
ncbi:MAG: hypothetical protein KAT58_09710 [candidate division Zixibacteria bacterium]|nr:hypothetical protein [candidate division Zixibacteria bacterium]